MTEAKEKVDDGGPAFPVPPDAQYSDGESLAFAQSNPGMTLRDYFAGQAIVGALASRAHPKIILSEIAFDEFARDCFKLADAMLTARKASH